MNINDKKQFATMWTEACALYGRSVTTNGLSLVFSILEKYTIEQVSKAISLHAQDSVNGRFPILPTHVISHIEGQANERGGSAWQKLINAMERVGSYEDVVFDDPIIHAIVESEGGWQRLSGMTYDDLKYVQNRFMQQYPQYVSKSGQFDYPKILGGSINSDRSAQGLEKHTPKMIGNQQKCLSVLENGSDKKLQISHDVTGMAEQILKIGSE